MKLKKCVLIVSFLIMMLFSTFFIVEASPEYVSGYYTFTVTDGEACITDVDTSISGEVTIPSTLDGYPVTSIGSSAFFACSKMTRVVIPEGVREIGAQAFAFCNITHITIPTTLKYVSSNVFMNTTKLNTVNISDLRSWCEIEFCEGASNPLCFSGDLYLNGSLVGGELVIPEGTTRIGSYAFNCYDKIGVLKIPASVTSIGEGAFLNCKGIYQLHISDLKKWCDFNFAEMHDNPLYYAQNLYLNGEEISGELAIPEGVTSIGAYAFYCCDQITDIIIPDSVTSIGECAFYLCEGVKSVSIGKGLESVGKNAFFFGGTLERVNITDLKQWCEIDIAKNLGYYFELQLNNEILSGEINIPEGTKTICGSAFYNCGEITSVTIPDSVTAIGDNAFDSCKGMKEVVITESVTYIGEYAFASCYSLSNVEIYGSADIKRAAFGWISIYEEGQLAFYAPPKSIEDDEYTIYKDVTILCYTDDSVTIDYANSYDRKIQFLPCKEGCCYVEFVDDAYLKSEATCTDSAVYYLSCECGAVSDETFKSGDPLDHIYDDVCDLDCNRCGDVRKAPHDINEEYESDGSSHWNECSLCNYIFNKNEHKYDSNHDAVCDVCGYERVLVVALTITNQPTSEIAREGEKISTTVIATGEGLTYTWYYTSNGKTTEFYVSSVTGATYTTVMNDSRAGRKVYCVITDKYDNSVTTEVVTLSMLSNVTITKQPTKVTVANGEKVATTVEATGEGLTYTWYYTSNGKTNQFFVSSVTGATYTTTMDATRDGRKVYCVITDKYGNSVTTDVVTLSMLSNVTITSQPTNETAQNGETVSTTVVAEGEGLTYTWYYTSNGNTIEFYVSSVTGATYTTVMNDSRAGRKVYCVISDKYGNSVTTDVVTLSMLSNVTITSQPTNETAQNGATVSTMVVAEGEGLTYTWYYTSNGNTTEFYVSSVTGATYTTVMNDSRAGRKVYCVITDKYGNSVTTEVVTLSMSSELAITKQPTSVIAANGEKVATTVTVAGEGLTYTWYYTSNGKTNQFFVSSVTGATYSTTMDATRDGRKVYCVITDKYGNTATTDTVTLSMASDLAITKQPTNVYVANGEKAETTVIATGEDLTYTWYYTLDKNGVEFYKSSVTSATYSTTMNTARTGRKVYCVITDKYGNSVTTDTAVLSLPSSIMIISQPKSASASNGSKITTTVAATGDGLTYTWYFTSNKAGVEFFVSSVTSATYTTTMDETRDGRKVYCVITDEYGNSVTTDTVTLSMASDLAITKQPTNVYVANGEKAETTVIATGEELTYTWYYTSNGKTSQFYVSSVTSATYTTTMDATRDGRKVYCVITDKYGNTVTTDTVTLTMK